MGSREDVASRIEADTKAKIDEMTKQVNAHKEHVSWIEEWLSRMASVYVSNVFKKVKMLIE